LTRTPRLSAIICAYNEERSLAAAIHSLFAQTRVPDEVIVVNNASTDRTREVAERVPGVVVVEECLYGGNFAVRRGALEAIGGFARR
jgi:glycosyltransferase involved in cell wall biosynthesis